jgi:DNA-binding MarR family transcriptional regulator
MPSQLYAEIHQTAPLTPVQEAAANLHRTAAILMQQISVVLAEHGLSPTQYNVLRILRGAGDGGLRPSDIARRLVSPDPDITRLVDRLVRRGWARRDRDDADRRVVLIRIAHDGLHALRVCDGPVQALQRTQFKRLSLTQLRQLTHLLEVVRT